jgi:hypothetical protein
MDTASGPFLTKEHALYNVALACAAYVDFSMDLVDGRLNMIERARSVIKGFHGLQAFASAHWLDYLVRLSETSGGFGDYEHRQLERVIMKLCDRYSRLTIACAKIASTDVPSDETKIRAKVFSHHESLQALAVDVWEAERIHAQVQEIATGEDQASNSTLFDSISTEYQSITTRLMSPDAETRFPELAAFFPDFRATHNIRPFTCTFARCSRRSDGFSSMQERDEHERAHRPRIMCEETSCQFSKTIGFANKAQLNKHTRKYHQVGPPSLPPFPRPRLGPRTISEEVLGKEEPSTVTDLENIGNRLSDLVLGTLPSEFRSFGTDWGAVFNPKVDRVLDIEEVHSLVHTSVVTSVCFSRDGTRIATSSDRYMKVFDTATGTSLADLRFQGTEEGEMYYRCVCFFPDSRFLASGNEAKMVEVCRFCIASATTPISNESVYRYGTPTLVRYATLSLVMNQTYTISMCHMTAITSSLLRVTEAFVCGMLRQGLSSRESQLRMALRRLSSHQMAAWSLLVHSTNLSRSGMSCMVH